MISLPLQEAADLVDVRLRAGDHACEVAVDLADGPVIPITASLDEGLVDQGRLVLGGGEGSHLALSHRGGETAGDSATCATERRVGVEGTALRLAGVTLPAREGLGTTSGEGAGAVARRTGRSGFCSRRRGSNPAGLRPMEGAPVAAGVEVAIGVHYHHRFIDRPCGAPDTESYLTGLRDSSL
jgi:hypothetical protein